jgi:integrase
MANRTNFTQLAIERLRPPATGRIIFWDKVLPGFGLRIAAPRPGSRDGRKTWIAMYRVSGKAVMETIATTAQIPSVAAAREAARTSILKAKRGVNAVEERRAEATRRQATQAREEAAARDVVEGRFDVVAERFLREHIEAKCSPNYAGEVRRILEHDVLPGWGCRPIRAITKLDVNDLLDAKASRRERPRKGTLGGAGVQSNRTLTRLRTLFAWAKALDLIDADPSAGVMPRGKETARSRVLSDEEIKLFWAGCETVGWPSGPILRLLLLTGQRESEVAGMRWSEIGEHTWTIPRERTKSDRAHVVHLSEFATEIIAGLPRLGGDVVFPTRNGGPVSSFSKARIRLDALMAKQAQEPIPPWVIHDLRRSAVDIMARLGVLPHVADKILNHSGGVIRGVAATYNRYEYRDERKSALEALGRFVATLVRPGGGNVVELRRA